MAVITSNLKQAICSLFEVHADEGGVQRVVTPLEYPGSSDQIVVRVRPKDDGFSIDENGEAAFYASLNGGDIDSGAVERWADELALPVQFTEDERLVAFAANEQLIAPYIFRVASAAQQLHSIATARTDRQSSVFPETVKKVVYEIAAALNVGVKSDVELPIAGGLKADHVIDTKTPLIVVTATSPTRLLEAEIIFMQYRADAKAGYILAVAESQGAVGKKQFERANYYTHKTVVFEQNLLRQVIPLVN